MKASLNLFFKVCVKHILNIKAKGAVNELEIYTTLSIVKTHFKAFLEMNFHWEGGQVPFFSGIKADWNLTELMSWHSILSWNNGKNYIITLVTFDDRLKRVPFQINKGWIGIVVKIYHLFFCLAGKIKG